MSQKVNYKDLTIEEKNLVRTLSYEYIFYLAAKWYFDNKEDENKAIGNIEEFNTYNELTTSKLLLYPFYYATANGCSEDLFGIMQPFYAREYGPVSEYLEKIVLDIDKDSKFKYFITDFQKERIDKFGLAFKMGDAKYFSSKTNPEKLLSKIISAPLKTL